MKKIIILVAILLVLLGIGWLGIFYYNNLRGVGPALPSLLSTPVQNANSTANKPGNQTNLPLKITDGFSISIFAKNLTGARVILFDYMGNMWVSQPSEGTISLVEIKNGQAINTSVIYNNLINPHGLAVDPADPTILYFAEETKISKVKMYSAEIPTKIIDLPTSADHITRTLGFGPDGRLYVSLGSTCNVCVETNPLFASIYSLNKDGSDLKQVAKGLRNSVFFVWSPFDNKMWATEMGRDLLGDDTPPDEINIIEEGKNYGWPICYGKNIHDTEFDKNTYIRNPCQEPFETPSHIDIQAHSAPLGLAFVPPNASWPPDFVNDLLVAYHGSWNRSIPTGYKVVRFHLDATGNVLNVSEFITGWLTGNQSFGRPVDLVFGPDGKLYLSDDKAGVIYLINNINKM